MSLTPATANLINRLTDERDLAARRAIDTATECNRLRAELEAAGVMTLEQLRAAIELFTALQKNRALIDMLAAGHDPWGAVYFDAVGREDAVRLLLDQAHRYLAQLNDLGVQCSMRDFGASD